MGTLGRQILKARGPYLKIEVSATARLLTADNPPFLDNRGVLGPPCGALAARGMLPRKLPITRRGVAPSLKGRSMPDSYPLDWPEHWPRTRPIRRRMSRFSEKLSFQRIRDDLFHSLELLGASHVTLSTEIPLTITGLPMARHRQPDDPGAAVYFSWHGKPYVIACDQYALTWENMRAISKTLDAMRAIERHGASSILERAVSGFTALPPSSNEPAEPPRPPWWEVLGIDLLGLGTSGQDLANDPKHPMRAPVLHLVELLWRQKVKYAHPDRGGSVEAMATLNRAIADARAALGKEE